MVFPRDLVARIHETIGIPSKKHRTTQTRAERAKVSLQYDEAFASIAYSIRRRYALGMMRGDMDDGEEDDKILLLDGEDDSVDEEYSDPSGYNGNHNHNHNKHSSASDNHQSNKKHESDLKSLEEGQMARINPISIPSS